MACAVVGNYREMDKTIIPTEFMAEVLNGVLATNQPPALINWDVPLPELLLFVRRVTSKAGIDYKTAMVALVLLSRLKKTLPKNAHGEYGTCHRLFLSAILVASKNSTMPYSSTSPPLSQEELPLRASALLIENLDQPHSPLSSSSSSSDEEYECNGQCNDTTNCNLAEISGIFSVPEVNRMEREFRRLLGGQVYVDDNDVKKFIENNKYALP